MNNMLKIFLPLAAVLLPSLAHSQEMPARDTIRQAVVKGYRHRIDAGTRIISPEEFRMMTTVTGEGDAVKFAQTLPGVSTGAEGSSAFYVRGGNLGSNLITLDGIPIYGSSHILGFSSAYSPDIVSGVEFRTGGFTSEESNLTSSHVQLSSKNGSFSRASAKVSASNFIAGGSFSLPIIKDKVSIMGAFRISPAGAEINAVKGLSEAMDSISNVKAVVYDVFGKVSWNISGNQSATFSVFNTLDSYGYSNGSRSYERMQWGNLILNAGHHANFGRGWKVDSRVAYNRFSNYQGILKLIGQTYNSLAVISTVKEFTAQSTISNKFLGMPVQGGLKVRYGEFSPGSASEFVNNLISSKSGIGDAQKQTTLLATAHGQFEYADGDDTHFRVAAKYSMFRSLSSNDKSQEADYSLPELSLLARRRITGWLGIEATADWTAQFYHTLEGIPLGWSLDMIIPSDVDRKPEKSTQYYAGLFFTRKVHSLSAGVYTKEMRNLVWFADATKLFNSAVAGWKDNVKTGKGSSKGVEVLYELSAKKVDGRIAYTLSDSDRTFEEVNGGVSFPASFDRKHILNVSLQMTLSESRKRDFGVSTFFTYQSGHWTSVPAYTYFGELPAGMGTVTISPSSGTNNWEMPAYVRWDIGAFWNLGKETRHPQTLNAGIFNVLNRHNAYGITYDASERKWKQISLFPIMPSLSWTMEF